MPDIDISHLNRVLIDLIKTIKVVSVYPDNNPIPVKLKESFVDRFSDIIRDYGTMKFNIEHSKIFLDGEQVYEEENPEESLAALFHNSGITEISFSPNFSTQQANQFLKTVKSYINKEKGAEDMVSLFWQADIEGFEYRTLEDVSLEKYGGDFAVQESCLYFNSPESSLSDSSGVQYLEIFLDDDETVPDHNFSQPAQDIGVELAGNQMGLISGSEHQAKSMPVENALALVNNYKLDSEEKESISGLLREDAIYDVYSNTVNLLREVLFQEEEYPGYNETVTIIEKIHSEFIRHAKINEAGHLLSLLTEMNLYIQNRPQQWKERLSSAMIMAGGWESIKELASVLNAGASITPNELKSYLSHFGWQALSAITDLLGVLENQSHREAICDYLIKNGKEHVDIISKGVNDKKWFVVRNTVSVLLTIGGKKVYASLEKAINHDDPRVRQNIAQSLSKSDDERNISLFTRLIWDNDELVRKTSLEAILSLSGEMALKTLVQIINDNNFRNLSNEEKSSLIMAFSRVGGEVAVNYLSSLVTDFKGTGGAVRDFYRSTAINALMINESDKAEKELIKHSKSWKKNIRAMAKDALKRRYESMNG